MNRYEQLIAMNSTKWTCQGPPSVIFQKLHFIFWIEISLLLKQRVAGSQYSVLFWFHMLSLSFIMKWIPVFQLLAEIAVSVV